MSTEALRESRQNPLTFKNAEKSGELFRRFVGKTQDGRLVYVQAKEDNRSGRKQLLIHSASWTLRGRKRNVCEQGAVSIKPLRIREKP